MKLNRFAIYAWAVLGYNLLVILFLISPLLVVVVASFNESEFLAFPPDQFSFRWYQQVLSNGDFLNSFYLSVFIAVVALLIAMLIVRPWGLFGTREELDRV